MNGTTLEGQLLRSRLCCPLEEKNHSDVNILSREDRLFERGAKESIYVKIERSHLGLPSPSNPREGRLGDSETQS